MSEEVERIHQPAAEISEEALKRAEEMIEEEEGAQNKFTGAMAAFITPILRGGTCASRRRTS